MFKAPVSRRTFLRSAAGAASLLQLTQAAKALGLLEPEICTLTAEQEVGPYYVANEMIRRDIREGKAGFPLTLDLAIMDSRTCKPLSNAAIDLWHCDAMGLYSGFTAMTPIGNGPGGPGGPPGFDPEHPERTPPPPGSPGLDPQHPNRPDGPPEGFGGGFPTMKPTDKLTFLRGVQFTDAQDRVRFDTILPGFYPGRTNHVHFKVRLDGHTADADGHRTYLAGHTSHIGQVFFPDEETGALMKQGAYVKHAIHRTTQAEDNVYNNQQGERALSKLRFLKPGNPEAGLQAELVVAVDPTAVPKAVGMGGPPSPRKG